VTALKTEPNNAKEAIAALTVANTSKPEKFCGQRIPGTTKACVRKARCNKVGVCVPSAVKGNPNKKCKKIGGGKGHCNTTTGVCQ